MALSFATLCALTILILGVCNLILYYSRRRHLYKFAATLEGPKAYPLIGNALLFLGDHKYIFNKIVRLFDEFPSPFRVWLGPRLFILVNDPKSIKAVLTSESGIHKGDQYHFLKPFIGEGLVSAPASKWRDERKSLSQAFNLNALPRFMNSFVKHSIVFTRKLESSNGEKVNISDYVNRLTFDIIYETMMETDLKEQTDPNCKLASSMQTIFELLVIRIFKLWLRPHIIFFNTAIGKEVQKSIDNINRVTSEIIKKKKMELESNTIQETLHENEGEEKKSKSFINLLVDLAKNEENLSEPILRDHINTIAAAGNDTIAGTIAFVFLMLATFPEVQKKVYQELDDIYGSSDPDEVLVKYNDLQHMDYLERVIKETLRIFPVVPIILREAINNIQVENNKVIPKGSTVYVGIFQLHRSEKDWPEPLKFDPDRFLPENISTRHPYSYIPFAGGLRNCIGGKFAMIEMKTIVATTLRKFIITIDKPVPVEEIDLQMSTTLKPIKPIMLRFKKRY